MFNAAFMVDKRTCWLALKRLFAVKMQFRQLWSLLGFKGSLAQSLMRFKRFLSWSLVGFEVDNPVLLSVLPCFAKRAVVLWCVSNKRFLQGKGVSLWSCVCVVESFKRCWLVVPGE